MRNKFKEGQRVRILPKTQLMELEQQGGDMAMEMFKYGGKEATIKSVLDSCRWLWEDLPEYILDIDNEDEDEERLWVWYENLLEPIE